VGMPWSTGRTRWPGYVAGLQVTLKSSTSGPCDVVGMKILLTSSRRLWSVLLGAVIVLVALAPPSLAATVVTLSATVTNTDGVAQNGTVCLELVGSGSCGGDDLVDGSWSTTWDSAAGQAGDYLIAVTSDTMDGATRWYAAGNQAGTADKSLATPVHLAAGASDLHFTMVMPALAKVSGKVVDSGNHGRAGLTVLISEDGLVRSTTTGTGGVFDLGYTRAGSATVSVEGGLYFLDAHAAVVVPESGPLVVPDLVVQNAATIAGLVTDSVTGNPIPFLDVDAYDASSHAYAGSTKTDATGRYVIGGLEAMSLVLRFKDSAYQGYTPTLNDGGDPSDWSPQTPIVIAAGGRHTANQTLVPVLPTQPTHTLSGTVTDPAGHPLAGIQVSAAGTVTRSGESDRLGHWYVNAPDGDYTLSFSQGWRWSSAFGTEAGWAQESYPGRLVSPVPVTVTVAGDAPDGLDVTLVRDLSNLTAPAIKGTAVPDQTLTATTGTWSVRTGTTYATTWLRDGVAVGEGPSYALSATDVGKSFRVRVTATNGPSVAEATSDPVTVNPAPVIPVPVSPVGPGAATVTARATSPRHGTVRIVVAVSAPGSAPAGTVTVRRGATLVKGAMALVNGRAVVVLRKQRSGVKRYTVGYSGSAQTLPATSPTIRVKVR